MDCGSGRICEEQETLGPISRGLNMIIQCTKDLLKNMRREPEPIPDGENIVPSKGSGFCCA